MHMDMEVIQKVCDRSIIPHLTQKPKPNRREREKQKRCMVAWALLREMKYLRISNIFILNEWWIWLYCMCFLFIAVVEFMNIVNWDLLKRANKKGRTHVHFLTIYILCSVKLPVFSYLQLIFDCLENSHALLNLLLFFLILTIKKISILLSQK